MNYRAFVLILLVGLILVAGCTSSPQSYAYESQMKFTTPTPTAAPTLDYRDPVAADGVVTFSDCQEANDLSLRVGTPITRSSYTPAGGSVVISAVEGSQYLMVPVLVTHRGYRGGGLRDSVYAPGPERFLLIAGGKTYRPINIRADHLTNVGTVYRGNLLVDRGEKYEGYIVYEVPEGSERGAIVVADIVNLRGIDGYKMYNFGPYDKNPAWRL